MIECQTITSTTGGTVNKLAKFDGTYTITNSSIFDNGSAIGINTTSPLYGISLFGTSYNQSTFSIERQESQAYGGSILFRSRKSTWGSVGNGIYIGTIGFQGPKTTTGNYATGAMIQATTTEAWSDNANGAKLVFQTTANQTVSSIPRMTIENNGNVGIGTTSPNALLSINTNTLPAPSDQLLLVSQPCSDSQCTFYPIKVGGIDGRVDIGLNGSYTVPSGHQSSSRLTVNHALCVTSNGSGTDYIAFNATESRIYSSQNIKFIGSDNITYSTIKVGGLSIYDNLNNNNLKAKITSDGKIWAQEIIVQLTDPWPDYVFEKDYSKMSLTELEGFIKQNKHLPGMPTADEISSNGVNLGQMDANLLKKIEELTLYVIELKNEIENLKIK